MKNEIERKFYVREIPNLSGIKPAHYERYILGRGNGKETRISKIDDKYFYEEKTEISSLERTRTKKEITEDEFENLKQNISKVIIRDRYNISSNPNITIQIYHGRFEGLIRAEVEFNSENEARSFTPPIWMGEEMTGLLIARDSSLLDLNDKDLKRYIK